MEIIMPKMGESITEGTILKWHKNIGDKIEVDEVLFEISTDKVDTEVPSAVKGILTEILVTEGETVEVGTVVAKVDGNKKNVAKNFDSKSTTKDKPKEIIVEENTKLNTSNIYEMCMPKMGESIMEGTILKWFKKVGDPVKKDETVFEISTDKVDTEVPSPVDGIVKEILVAEQETVEVGTIVVKISSSENPEEDTIEQKEVKTKQIQTEHATMHDVIAASSNIENRSTKQNRKNGNSFLSPLVLSIANKEGLSLDEIYTIQGSGLNRRITKKDVLKYIDKGGSQLSKKVVVQTQNKGTKIEAGFGVTKIPMDNIRQRIMHHMVESKDTSVHVSAMLEVDVIKIYNFINSNKDRILNENGIKLTYMAFIAYACVKALKKYPLVNSTIDGKTILQKNFVNLGIAVAMEPNGLIVPNIKGAEQRNILGLAKAINDLANNTRNKKLSPDDITNGTFTITNYGVFGTIFGTPIINQPEVAILGVGTVIKKPVVIEVEGNDTISIRPIMALTLSHDHRLVDGMLGGQFLKFLKETLEGFEPNNF
ncbi:MAG: 2-oxoglutarate dehydrogenase [Ignavibacteriales bacterium CG_4_9_14_3_um_filter_30_11]|nr:MAG: 2-oxoglutarate dehydrogenase [Ignavibacteriales bacterium CG_4_9_14_3_um_filter_30_11]